MNLLYAMSAINILQASAMDPIAATEAWMQTMTAEDVARSDAYFEGGYWLILWNFLIGLAVAWLLLGRKRSVRVRDWLARKLPKFLVFSVFMFLATPVLNSVIRNSETQADIFGFNAAAEPDGAAEAYMMLSEYRKMRPGKWEEIIFFDHPAGYTRVLNAMKWKAAHQTIDETPLTQKEEKYD